MACALTAPIAPKLRARGAATSSNQEYVAPSVILIILIILITRVAQAVRKPSARSGRDLRPQFTNVKTPVRLLHLATCSSA